MSKWIKLKYIPLILVIISAIILLAISILGRTPELKALDEIGANLVRSFSIAESIDTHGGLLNDGKEFIKYEGFDKSEILRAVSTKGWHSLPIPDTVSCILYGGELHARYTDRIPEVKSGYWYFKDRQNNMGDISVIFTRPSANFTVAVYDSAHNSLYYFRYDS
ncbi:MAG: hypothetical protein VB078_02365 [Clostridiaceae bacterium]|nr:hypothetical protein [Clostridiaceae bacterium]